MTPSGAGAPDRIDRRLLSESRAARAQLRLATGLGLVTAVAVVAQAALLARVIGRSAQGHVTLSALAGTLAVLAGVIVVRAGVAGAFETSGRIGATRVMSELRGRLAEQLLVRSPVHRADDRTGELAAAAVQGVDSLEAYFAGYLPQLVLGAAVPAAVLIWVLPLDPIADVVLAVTIPILIGFMVLIGKGAQAKARSRWRALSVLELCAMMGTALVAATIGVQLDGGHLGLQAGLTVLLLAPELYAPLRAVGQQFHASTDAMAAAERIFAVLDAPAAVAGSGRPGARLPDPACERLQLERVSFAYPDRDELVLADLDLVLEPGETTALVGPSGVGKTTVAALVLRLADPTDGRVSCGGVDLRDLDPDAWRAQLAWVPQRTRIFAGTIGENIALYQPDSGARTIGDAATAAGLRELIDALPAGLETMVGESGRGLSAGQAQRVGVARAFLRQGSLLVLDEPTAHLDRTTAAALGDALVALSRGRTTLLITHDRALAAQAGRTVALDGGRAVVAA